MSEITEEETRFNAMWQDAVFTIRHDGGRYKHLTLEGMSLYDLKFNVIIIVWPEHISVYIEDLLTPEDSICLVFKTEGKSLLDFTQLPYIAEEADFELNFIRVAAQYYEAEKREAEQARNR